MNKNYFLKRIENKNLFAFQNTSYELLPESFNVRDKVSFKCSIHGVFKQMVYQHFYGMGCPICSRIRGGKLNSLKCRLTQEMFVTKAMRIHKGFYSYEKSKYETNESKITIVCPIHGEFIQKASSHLDGCGCNKCYLDRNRLKAHVFIDNARKIHGDKYYYSNVVYLGNKKKVEIVCSTHGSFWQKPNGHTSNKAGCPFCSESKGERAVEIFLKKYGLNFIREYKIKPHLFRYDFYLPDYHIFIEFHGHQHYRPVEIFGGEQGFFGTKERDKTKEFLVKSINGKLIILSHLNLQNNSIEKYLINYLKKAYVRWYVIDNKIIVFKNFLDIYQSFNIDKSIIVKNIDYDVEKRVKDFKVLF